MSMSKKDFIALADELNRSKGNGLGPSGRHVSTAHVEGWDDGRHEIIDALCRFMARQNPQFKEERWRAYLAGECGPNGGSVKGS